MYKIKKFKFLKAQKASKMVQQITAFCPASLESIPRTHMRKERAKSTNYHLTSTGMLWRENSHRHHAHTDNNNK